MLNYIAVVQHDGTASSITYRMGTNAFVQRLLSASKVIGSIPRFRGNFIIGDKLIARQIKPFPWLTPLLPYPSTEDQSRQLAQTHICPIL